MHNFSYSEQFASISRILPLNFVKFENILWLHPREILGYFLLFILNHKALMNLQSSIHFLKLRYQIHQLSCFCTKRSKVWASIELQNQSYLPSIKVSSLKFPHLLLASFTRLDELFIARIQSRFYLEMRTSEE